MYLHVVMLAFNQELSSSLRSRIEDCLRSVPRTCAGVERFALLDNHSRTSARYTHALLSVFSTERALDAYRGSAAHDQLLEVLGPHIQEIVVLDSVLAQDLPA